MAGASREVAEVPLVEAGEGLPVAGAALVVVASVVEEAAAGVAVSGVALEGSRGEEDGEVEGVGEASADGEKSSSSFPMSCFPISWRLMVWAWLHDGVKDTKRIIVCFFFLQS